MVIDLAGLTFMDCGGYRCLVACRLAIGGRGGTLVIRGQTGQPARLLDLIRGLEAR
jgi:anti-anti-sigma regulatory factor